MTLDKNLFSENQAVTGTAVSDNTLRYKDTGGDGDVGNIGDGQNVRVYAQVTADFATCTSIQVQLQTSANNSDWDTVLEGPVVPVADAVAGKVLIETNVPKGMSEYHRLNYVIAGSNATAGTVTAGYAPAT